MKLYVWEGDGVLTDYSNGIICVLANDFEEAIKLIEKKCDYAIGKFPINKYRIVEKPEAFLCWGGYN